MLFKKMNLAVYGKDSFHSKKSHKKILKIIYFAYYVGIINPYSNRIIINNKSRWTNLRCGRL